MAAPIAQFSGLASGIDSKALIDAVIQAKLKNNELRQEQIDFITSESDALAEVKKKLLNLSDLIDKFRTANGGGVTKKASSSDASVATAAVSASASNSSIGIVVGSVAATATGSFTDSYADGNDLFAPNAVGTQTIGVSIGSGASLVNINVDVTSATTAQGFVDAFNADANAQGRATASIVKIADGDYRVVISTAKTGVTEGQLAFTIPAAGVGFGGNTDLQTQTVQQATDAAFSISGIAGTITRSTNSVSDVLTGVTFQLSKAGTATIGVSDDADTTADSFKEIVDAFNDIVEYANENNLTSQDNNSSDRKIIYGTLAKTKIDDDFLSQFRQVLLGAGSETTGSVQSFADLGITTNRDGTIKIDQEIFKTGVGGDSTGAAQVLRSFADASAGVSGFIYQFTTFQGFIDNETKSNLTQIDNLNDQIEQLQRSADSTRESLTKRFANLESVTARLQQQQSALTASLAGLQGG